MVETYYTPENWERYRRAEALAKQKGVTTNQVALAWVLHQPFPVFPLVGPWTVSELENSVGALDVALTADESAWLDLQA